MFEGFNFSPALRNLLDSFPPNYITDKMQRAARVFVCEACDAELGYPGINKFLSAVQVRLEAKLLFTCKDCFDYLNKEETQMAYKKPEKQNEETTKETTSDRRGVSRGFNRVTVVGNLGADPEVRFMENGGKAICNFRMAASEKWKDKDGQSQERTEWFNIVTFGPLAEICGEHLKKGRACLIEGRLQTRTYEKDGETKYMTEVVANQLLLL